MHGVSLEQAMCPYCSVRLPKAPARSVACPSCKKTISVDLKQTLFPRPLLRRSESLTVGEYQRLLEAPGWGVTPERFRTTQEALSERFGQAASYDDTLWTLYGELSLQFAKAGDLENASLVYHEMARHLYARGKDFFPTLQEAYKVRMQGWKMGGYGMAEIRASGECPACKSMDGKRFSPSEAMKLMPLPAKDCQCQGSGYCTCRYVAVADAQGQL
jgi:hypothetical protein